MPIVKPGEPQSTSETFSPTAMLERIGGDMLLFKELVQIFQEDYPPLVDEIRQAIADNDASRLKLAAHTLRGAIGNFTIASPYDLAKRLEAAGTLDDLRDAEATFGLLAAGVAQLAAMLSQCVAESVS